MSSHALTIHKRTERDGRVIHLAAVCSCGHWTEASTTSALADELLADPGLRLTDRLHAAWITHEARATDPTYGLTVPGSVVLLTFPSWCGACCQHYDGDPDATPDQRVAAHRAQCPYLTRRADQ